MGESTIAIVILGALAMILLVIGWATRKNPDFKRAKKDAEAAERMAQEASKPPVTGWDLVRKLRRESGLPEKEFPSSDGSGGNP